ncbi:MAG TPA: branched-chain amino acid ABC transporter permease [Kofleriaceae bacterium]
MTAVSATAAIAGAPARRISGRMGWLVALLIAATVAPFVLSDYHVFQATQIVVYAIAVLGFNLLTGFSGQISLGNGAFYALGAYITSILMTQYNVPYWATLPVAGAACFGVGFLFGRSATRLEGLYLALATFGLAIAMPQVLKLDALERWTGGSQGVVLNKPVSPIGGLLGDDRWLYFFCLAVAIVLFTAAWNVMRGRTGRAMIALRDHPIAAGTMGIHVPSYKARVFGVSAMYTGIAGALSALVAGFVAPDSFTFLVSIAFLIGGVVGGVASIFGSLFGAAFIELVPDLAKQASELWPSLHWLADVQWPAYGVLLIVTMMVMPGGMAGLIYSVQLRLAHRAHRAQRAHQPSRS